MSEKARSGRPGEPWGLMAEFATADELVAAARAVRAAGCTGIEAYAPFHVEGLAEAVGFRGTRVAGITFIGGVIGGVGAYLMQWYSAVVDYPVNIGGRPLHSWPMFIPITFEMVVLGAALAALLTLLLGSGLPRLSHPVFNARDFDLATRNRFFLCLRSDAPGFDARFAAGLLDELKPLRRTEVPRVEVPRVEVPRVEIPKAEGQRVGGQRVAGRQVEAPRGEAPE